MANHVRIAAATGIDDLLLRPALTLATRHQREHQRPAAPVLPQGHRPVRLPGPGYLDHVAAELNDRPRKRLGWRTPAEALDELLSEPSNPPVLAPASCDAQPGWSSG